MSAARLQGDLPDELHVRISPMRRRHLRAVLRIEAQVYPRPWSFGLFVSELSQKGTRCYVVAHVGRTLVGYAGMLQTLDDAHVTNIAVDPAWHRHGIGARLLLTLVREAQARGLRHVTLEVRVSNHGAQALYRRFGFVPAGIRKDYYPETPEDALVMWAHDIDTPAYAERLAAIEASVRGSTSVEGLREAQ